MTEGELYISKFPGIRDYTPHGPRDFLFRPTRQTIEVKDCTTPQAIPSGYDGVIMQLQWRRIYPEKFDWLILYARVERVELWLWLLPRREAWRFVTETHSITYTPGRRRRLDVYRITPEDLFARCNAGHLSAGDPAGREFRLKSRVF